MKITIENASVMKLRDNNFTGFIMGAVLFLVGAAILVFLPKDILPMAVGAVFALLGLYLFFTTKIVNVVLDKGSGKFSLSLRGILGGGAREMELSRITGLILQKSISTSRSSKGNSSTNYDYTLKFVTDSKEEIPLEFGRVSAGLTDMIVSPDEAKRRDAKKVADFLGVQIKEVWPPSVGEMMGMIKSSIDSQMAERQKP